MSITNINSRALSGSSTPKLSQEAEQRVEELKKLYPDAKSAIMPALYLAQEELGYVSKQAIEWVASKIGCAPAHVMQVASFYTMYYKKPVGKYHVQICRTLSCALRGAKELTECMHRRTGLLPGEVSADGNWSYEEVECLGSCGSAPLCEINDSYFENLTVEKFNQLLDRIEKDKPRLRLSTLKDELGQGLSGCPKSEVI